MAGLKAVLAKDGKSLKYAQHEWLPSARGHAMSVILFAAGKQGIASGIQLGQQVLSIAPLMQNRWNSNDSWSCRLCS
jgi:hypothetical protein